MGTAACLYACAALVAALVLGPAPAAAGGLRLLAAAAAPAPEGSTANGSGPSSGGPSYVISAAAQAGAGQPYARGCQNRVISLTVGSGGAAVPYQFAVDTGSSLLEIACQSAASQANCGGKALSQSYVLTAANTIASAAECATTGIDCFLPGTQGQPGLCYFSQGLTGGTGYNGRKGSFAQDQVTVATLGGAELALNVTIACAQSSWSCGEFNSSCISTQEACPSALGADTLQGGCPQDGKGFELGFTFALPSVSGGRPSAASLPEQVYQAGLIQERALGVCWQPPQKDSNCSAAIAPNSAVVLGPALPLAVPNATAMQSAPLLAGSAGGGNATGAASTLKYRSAVVGASVPVFGSDTPWNTSYTAVSIQEQVTILWDTGAEGMLMVPSDAFAAFIAYYTAASQQAKANLSFSISPCDATVLCGHSTPSGADAAYACQSIALPADATAADVAAAGQALLGLYPPSVDVLLEGGAVAPLPGAVLVNDCTGPGNTQTAGVAACSYMRGPVGDMGQSFWAASPFFTGRFVQFEVGGGGGAAASAPAGSVGTVRFSDPIPSCSF